MKHKLNIPDESEGVDDCDRKMIKQSKSTKDEVLRVKQKLKEENEVLSGLEQFNGMFSSSGDGLIYIDQYLTLTPDCKDLLTPIVLSKSAPKNIELVWNIVEKILAALLELDETSESLNFSPHIIISNILQNNVDMIYFSLYKVPKLNIRTSVLNCLALMLSHGVQAVREFQKHFHFPACYKQLKECAKVTKKGGAQAEDTRSSFVRFYLAFLVFGDIACIKKHLEEKDCSAFLMAELHLDRIENVMIVLETIEEKIINEANLLRTSKLSFFTQQSLLKLTFLMKHIDDRIKTQASKMLTTLCTDRRFGLCFPTKAEIFQGKLVNPVLLKFIVSVKQSAMSREDMLDLSIETLNACPDIIVPYMSGLGLNLDPRQADMWCSKTTFLVKLWEGIKMVDKILSQQKESVLTLPLSHKEFILKLTIPHQITRQLFTQGMKNKVNRVKQATLQLLDLSLSRCIALKTVLQCSVKCEGELTQWVDSMMNVLPDVTPVIGIRQMTAMSSDGRREDASSNINKDGDEVTEDMMENEEDEKPAFDPLEMDIMLRISMKCLHMYQTLKPGVLTLSGFNISKILSFSRQVSRDIMIQSLDILLNESMAGSWVKKSGLKNNIFDVMLHVMLTWKGEDEIISKSKRLFVKVLNGMGQFDNDIFEVDLWVASFINVADPSGLNLLAQSCVKTVNEPFAYLEKISKLFKDQQLIGNENADFKLPSPLFFTMLRNRLVLPNTIKQCVIPVLKELLVTQRNPRLFTKVILEEVSDNVDSYKDIMTFSYHWMHGLGLDPAILSATGESDVTLSLNDTITDRSCMNNIASYLVQLKGTEGVDEVKSLLLKISQMKEEFDSFCSDCQETSVKAVKIFIINVIKIIYCFQDILTPCHELQQVFGLILSSVKLLLKKHSTIMGSQLMFQELFNLPMLKSLDLEEAVWRRFSQNIHLEFLEGCEASAFRSSEVVKCFIHNLVSMMGNDSRTKSSEAVKVLCEVVSLLDDCLFQETALKISLLVTDGQQNIFYPNYLTVLQSMKTCAELQSRGSSSTSFVFSNSTSSFLHESIHREDIVMMELFLTIISLCHCKGVILVTRTDYQHLLQLKSKHFMDFALWMSFHYTSVVDDILTGAKPVCCNDKVVEDIVNGNIAVHHVIANLCPLVRHIIHQNNVSYEPGSVALQLKTSLWDTLLHSFNATNSESTAPLLELLIPLTTYDEKMKCLEKLKCLLTTVDDLGAVEIVLECCAKSLTTLNDVKEVKKCLIDIVSILMENLTKALTTDRYKISINYLMKFLSMMSKMNPKLKSSYYNPLCRLWNKFVKKTLKCKYSDNVSMSALSNCVAVFYKDSRFVKACSLPVEELFDFIVSHSKFLQILLSESTEKRDSKVTLIRTISLLAELSGSYKLSLVPLLLMCYEGSLSEKDTLLLSCLHEFETQGVSLSKFYPFVWGSKAYEVYKGMDLKSSLFKERSSAQVLECVDKVKMLKSATHFPIHMTFESRGDLKHHEEDYDPLFFLPIFVNVLQPEYVVDCAHFLESGCLALTLSSLSSHDPVLRRLGYSAISLFTDHLQLTGFREKNCLTYLFMLVKNSVSEENLRFPSIWTSFLSQYLYFILKPDHHLYTVLSNLILMKPVINIKELPVFLNLFNSPHMEHTVEQSWLLKLLGDSLKDVSDYYLYKKHHVFELTMAFYSSQVCDQGMKALIYNLLQAACSIDVAAFDLVKTHSILLWIHRHLNVETNESLISPLYFLVYSIAKTFQDSAVEEKNHILPKLMADELSLICEEALQNISSLNKDNHWYIIFVFMYLHSTPNYLGTKNFLVNTDIRTCFDCALKLLAEVKHDGEKSEVTCRFLQESVRTLQENGDTTIIRCLNWKELFHIGREGKLNDVIDLCDNLISWSKKTNNLDIIENHMYHILDFPRK